MASFGFASYPGINQIVRASFTLSHGVSPSVCTIEMAPQAGLPAPIGVLQFEQTGDFSSFVAFPDCKVNTYSYERNQAGLLWRVQILDRRWRWEFGEIHGAYNLLNDDDTLDTDTAKTPQELATLCLLAMGEAGFDVSELPNDVRPLVEWEGDNPAQMLDELVNALGCRVVLRLNNSSVKICRAGFGDVLPTAVPVMDNSGAFVVPAAPSAIKVLYAPTRVQVAFSLQAVGLDTDGEIKAIDSLSYTPAAGWASQVPGFFAGVNNTQATVPGEGITTPRTLAIRTVWKWYRITMLETIVENFLQVMLPDLGDLEDIEQFLPLLPDLISVDEAGKRHKPFVQGAYDTGFGNRTNTGTFDYYVRPFSLNTDKGIVEFNDYVTRWVNNQRSPASLYLTAACTLRQTNTRAVHRFYRAAILNPQAQTGAKIVKNEDASLSIVLEYDSSGFVTQATHNLLQLEIDAQAVLAAAVVPYQITEPYDLTYAGIIPINPDGAIQQVTWTVQEGPGGGAFTRASRNSEWNLDLPNYKERHMLNRLRVNRELALIRRNERRRHESAPQAGGNN
jgi:hypothetical protein